MSDLNSVFDVHFGWPNSCALSHDFPPKDGVTLPAGTIVKTATVQLRSAVVLRMKTDATGGGSPPTLLAADAGKAYVVNTWGAGYNDGDIVEWDGAAFNVVVANDTGLPPYNTRVVVIEASAAGSFSGQANKVMYFKEGDHDKIPDAWTVADTPASGNKIDINGAASIYYQKRFLYTTAWALMDEAAGYAHAHVEALTSPAKSAVKPAAWVVIEGDDQFDGEFANRCTCVKLATGCTVKVKCAVADTLAPDDYVDANAGLVVKNADVLHAIGRVDWSNGVSGTGGIIIFTGV